MCFFLVETRLYTGDMMKCLKLFLLIVVLVPNFAFSDTPIRIGTNIWPGYEPLYLARELGYFDIKSVRLVEYPSATEVLRAFRNKALEAAALTLDEVLTLSEANIPVKVILVLDVSNGGDVILASPEVINFKELKNKRIAVESGALGAYMITRALEVNGMDLNDVTIAHLDVDAHEEAFVNGRVDAAVTFEPIRTRLISAGAHEIFSSRELPGEIVDVLVVHKDLVILNNGENVKKLVQGWFKALAYLHSDQQHAAKKIAQRLKISPDEVLASFDGLLLPTIEENRQMLGGNNPGLVKTLEQLHNTMLTHELLIKPVAADKLLSDKFLE